MRFYIGGDNSDFDTIRKCISRFTSLGHTVTLDWTTEDYFVLSDRNKAVKKTEAIAFSDFCVFVGKPSDNMFYEIGVGVGLLKDVYVVKTNPFIFSRTTECLNHPSVVSVNSLEEVEKKIKEYMEE